MHGQEQGAVKPRQSVITNYFGSSPQNLNLHSTAEVKLLHETPAKKHQSNRKVCRKLQCVVSADIIVISDEDDAPAVNTDVKAPVVISLLDDSPLQVNMIDISNKCDFRKSKKMIKEEIKDFPKKQFKSIKSVKGNAVSKRLVNGANCTDEKQQDTGNINCLGADRNIWSDYLNDCANPLATCSKSDTSSLSSNDCFISSITTPIKSTINNGYESNLSCPENLRVKRKPQDSDSPAHKRKKIDDHMSPSKNNLKSSQRIFTNKTSPTEKTVNVKPSSPGKTKVNQRTKSFSPPKNLLDIYETKNLDVSDGLSDEDDFDLPAFCNIQPPALCNLNSLMENSSIDDVPKTEANSYFSESETSNRHWEKEVSHSDEIEDKSLEEMIVDINSTTEDNVHTQFECSPMDFDSPVSSQVSDSSVNNVLQMLKSCESKNIPLTPRKQSRSTSFESFHTPPETKPKEKGHVKRTKLRFTLNRMVRDKQEGEMLKQTEEDLLQYVKSGGVSRFINSSDEEDEGSTEEPDDEEYKVLREMTSCSDDCKGLPNNCPPVKLFKKDLLFRYFCPHTLLYVGTEGEAPNALSRLKDVASQLKYLKSGHVRQIIANKSSLVNIMQWLLKVVSCHTDRQIVNQAKSVLTDLLQTYGPLDPNNFDQMFCNFGVKPEIMSCQKTIPKPCCVCKKNKPRICNLHSNLCLVLKIFAYCLRNSTYRIADMVLAKYVTIFCIMLSITSKESELKSVLRQALSTTVNAVHNWQDMRLIVTREVLNQVEDYHTLESLASDLPTNTAQCVQLRRSLAQSALHRCLENSQVKDIVPRGIDNGDLQPVAALSKKLTVPNVRSFLNKCNKHVSHLKVLHVLWSCVLLVQISIGNDKIPKQQKAPLEEISASLSALDVGIRDGSLYCSEVKHFIRLTTARIDFQLEEMPKQISYQRGIFKYLRSSRVSEEMVNSQNIDTDPNDELREASPEKNVDVSEIASTTTELET